MIAYAPNQYVALPIVVAPSVKMTDPPGKPPPGAAIATVARSVTRLSARLCAGVAVAVIVVDAGFTVTMKVELAALNCGEPAKDAVIWCVPGARAVVAKP